MGAALTVRTILLSLGSWLIPFPVSFLFFDCTEQLLMPQPLLIPSISLGIVAAGAATLTRMG